MIPRQGEKEGTLVVGAYSNSPATSARIYNNYILDCEPPFGDGKMFVDLLIHFTDVKVAFIPVPKFKVLIENV